MLGEDGSLKIWDIKGNLKQGLDIGSPALVMCWVGVDVAFLVGGLDGSVSLYHRRRASWGSHKAFGLFATHIDFTLIMGLHRNSTSNREFRSKGQSRLSTT